MTHHVFSFSCFVCLAETGSFTKTAQKMGRTQSAISQQIAKLEDLAQTQFFIRGKNMTLTPHGEIFLTYAQKILHLYREAMDQFRHPDLHGEIRFGLPEDFASIFLSDVLREYAALHPRIMLNIECDLTLNLFQRFKNKEFDLVLVKMHQPQDFPNGLMVWSEKLEWVGHDHVLSAPYDKIPLVLSPRPCVYRACAIDALERGARKWRTVFSSHSYASTIAAVKAGMGVTVLPHNMIPKDLKILHDSHRMPKLDNTHISLLKHNNENAAVNSLESFVAERIISH